MTRKVNRREFMKVAGVSAGVCLGLAGCADRYSFGPSHTVFLSDESFEWYDVSEKVDNTLENGFAFDFRDEGGRGLRFGKGVEDGEGLVFEDARGFGFSYDEKDFVIKDLRLDDEGLRIRLGDGENEFQSRSDLGDDVWFSGLENFLKERGFGVNSSLYNDEVQDDAYFRVEYDRLSDGGIEVRRLEKVRVEDSGAGTWLKATSRDIDVRNSGFRDKRVVEGVEDGLRGDFAFDFTSERLEARIDSVGRGISIPYEFLSKEFDADGKNYVFRYVILDTEKVHSGKEWNLFYPVNGIEMEILEDPERFKFFFRRDLDDGEVIGSDKHINVGGVGYNLKFLGSVIESGRKIVPDFEFEVERDDGEVESLIVKSFRHGYPNRVFDINVDPDLVAYHTLSHGSVHDEGFIRDRIDSGNFPGGYSFLVSGNKFSLRPDFFSDGRFFGMKKTLSSDLNQHTLANRLNGEIKGNSFVRVDADFGVKDYRRHGEYPGSSAYSVEAYGDAGDQIKNGYIFRLNKIEVFSEG